MTVRIETMPEMRVAALRHTGPYHTIGEAFSRLGAIVDRAGLLAPPASTMLAIYHDDPEATPQAELRSDAGLVVAASAEIPQELHEVRIPGGRYACTTHVGAYSKLSDAWGRLMGAWLPTSGHRVAAGPSYEIYRSDHSTTPASELRTDIYVPIA